jgi:DNA-binding response OmpR family regulator
MTRDGEEIILSRTAYRMLEFLMRRAGRAIFRNAILNSIWDHSRKYLDVYIRMLRIKLDQDHEEKLIQTVREATAT